jgi:hemerythrin
MAKSKLVWDDKYSVQVEQIDLQHKKMFDTINYLIDVVSISPKKEQLDTIIAGLVEYKKLHFATEEKYFEEFHYDGAEEHKIKHAQFSEHLDKIVKDSNGDSVILAFSLIDFLEDWLITHLMNDDQKYISCFKEHGLK